MLRKNARALFRAAAFLIVTSGIYVIWWAGKFFAADKLEWRNTAFNKWAVATAKIANMKIERRGDLPAPPFFLVSNHLSYMDIAAYGALLKCFFVAKSEVADWFFIGKLTKDIGTIFVNRQNRRDILRAANEVAAKIAAGESLVIFPEGTSSRGETVLPFKSSFLELAAANSLPVSYASISYRTDDAAISAGDEICWWGDADFLPHLWRLFQIEQFTATIAFGDDKIKNSNRKELAAQLQAKVSEQFLPVL